MKERKAKTETENHIFIAYMFFSHPNSLKIHTFNFISHYRRSDQSLMPNPVMLDSSAVDGSFPVVKSASTGHISMLNDDNKEEGNGGSEDVTLDVFDDEESHASLDYRFSIGQLPNWAKAKVGGMSHLFLHHFMS